MRKIILASQSERRFALLSQLGLEFEVEVSGVDEDKNQNLSISELVLALAQSKAQAVATRHPDAIVIGADTLIYFAGEVIGKPKDEADALRILRKLNGQTHQVFTGLVVIDTATGKTVSDFVESKVTFKQLPIEDIQAYVATGEPLDKAGGYGLQSKGIVFLDKVEGDYTNVIGLPLPRLVEVLDEFGVKVFSP